MAFNYLEKRLSRLLERYGKFVASHFLWFIVIPLILSAILGLGGLRLHQNTDTEYLFSPENGPAKKHRREIEKHFDVDFDGGFLPDRRTEVGRYAHALILVKNGDGSVLTEDVLEEIIKFHEKAVNLTVTSGKKVYSYGDVCAKWKTDCVYPNLILKLLNYNAGSVCFLTLSYPVTNVQKVDYFIGSDLGGVTLQNNSEIIKTAKAMSLLYSLRSDELDDVSGKWEEAFVDFAQSYESRKIEVTFFTSKTLDHDFVDIVLYTIPLLIYACLVLTVFSVLSCTMFDWVTSKPVLATLGVVSAALAVGSSFGLLLFCGVPFTHLVIGMPFLTLVLELMICSS
ncbi:patched domain-containing protein 3-like isoform X3 [Ptychodera flava]|uniref:patched domain-containing protein 3-like isoform X3 n=1 Tax=Ptychodera flava TaxID=63121 RepID=UPI00396A19E8